MNTRSMLIAAVVAGVVMSVIAVIPFVGCANICLCLWVGIWGSGILAAWIYQSSAHTGLTLGQGVLLGLLAGAIGAVLVTIFNAVIGAIFTGISSASYLNYLNQIPGASDTIPEASRDLIRRYASQSGSFFFSLVCNFIVYPFFGMIGGLIGGAIFGKK
jgi:hypothetical protein